MREGDAENILSFNKGREPMTRRDELLARISIDPNVCFGKPCIRGHRIWVSLVLDFLASGWSIQDLLKEYPGLVEDDVLACIAYGAEMSRERYIEIPAALNS
jgi:uncharacterized protein (DUF433 family)